MDVSKNRGVLPPKWMVKIMENLIKMDDLVVFPFFWKHQCKFYDVFLTNLVDSIAAHDKAIPG